MGRHPEPACVSSVCFTFGVLVLTRVVCVCESVAERLSTAWRQLDKDVAAAKRGASARMATAIDAAVSSVRVRFGRPDAVVAAAAPSSSSPSPPLIRAIVCIVDILATRRQPVRITPDNAHM